MDYIEINKEKFIELRNNIKYLDNNIYHILVNSYYYDEDYIEIQIEFVDGILKGLTQTIKLERE